jgi:hypothetical protein
MSDIIGVAKMSGRGAVWLARLLGVQEVGSSNLPAPTIRFGPETNVSGFFVTSAAGGAYTDGSDCYSC